jgi:hypothetical protein
MNNIYDVLLFIFPYGVIDPCKNNTDSQIKLSMIATLHMMEKKRATLKSEVLYTNVE